MGAKGIQFLVDTKGEKAAVVIDLRQHRGLWEDIYDVIVAWARRGELRISWSDVRIKSGRTVRKRA